jgi:hypothetical protein
LAIASKGKGKSGGARVITHIVLTEKEVYLLTIYNKSEKEDLSIKELQELLAGLPEESDFTTKVQSSIFKQAHRTG